jgi:LPS export ABC transporter protein LptC
VGILAVVIGLIVMEIVALSPSSVEQEETASNMPIDPETLVPDPSGTLAEGIPKDRIPEYQVERFDYVSTQRGEKQWKLLASRAALYNKEKLVHAREIKANLFDPDGKVTLITGREAKYFMNHRDLEVFGDVVATFPDGFVLYSDYLRYRPNERMIEIPAKYFVHGSSKPENGQEMKFESHGFHEEMGRGEIQLPHDVRVTMEHPERPDDNTTIESDHCLIHRNVQHADFTMSPERRASERFVHILQPTLFTRSRRARRYYGNAVQGII